MSNPQKSKTVYPIEKLSPENHFVLSVIFGQIVEIRRARYIFMKNCVSLQQSCQELLTGLLCAISKYIYVITTRMFFSISVNEIC